MIRALVPLAHLALSAVFLLWDIVLAGRIAQQRVIPQFLAGLSAIGGLLVAPAFLIFVASTSILLGRSLHGIAWVWPVTTAIIAAQAVYATTSRRVSPLIGAPIVVYDVLVAATAVARYLVADGDAVPAPLRVLLAASTTVQAVITTPAAAVSALHTPIPLLAPAHPARWRSVAWWRVGIAALAAVWAVLVVGGLRDGNRALDGYDHLGVAELRPRPGEPFAVGLEIFPEIASLPQPLVIRNDLTLVAEGEVRAVLIALDPGGVTNLALDSVRRVLEPLRRDGVLLLAAIRAPEDTGAPADSAHLAVVERIARRLRPDYILPLDDPSGTAPAPADVAESRIAHRLAAARAAARRADPRIRIGLSIVPATSRDSALYEWAVSPRSPVDAVGFTFLAGPGGAPVLAGRLAAAERWMRLAGRAKEHWVFRAGGLPMIHGDASQEAAIAGILGWAMPRPGIRGAIVTHAGDYGTQRGLRGVSGRVRPAFAVVVRAGREANR
jgi:hypothetical protein